jgi:site-specific DNA recombinase
VCREFAKRDGITILEEHIYFDEAQSGSIRARPGLEALKRATEDKQFDAVLVDDSSRLSRDNQHFNTLLCLFQFWGISLISVSDGLDMREEHAKVAYQFRGIINELYLTDLKKKTHRGQMGQVLRGFSVGTRGYGYSSAAERVIMMGGMRIKLHWACPCGSRRLLRDCHQNTVRRLRKLPLATRRFLLARATSNLGSKS